MGQAIALLSAGADTLPQTQAFFQAYAQRDSLLLVQTLSPMEKWKRDQAIPVLQQWLMVLEEALTCRSGMEAISPSAARIASSRSGQELMQAAQNLQKAIEYAQGNVSVAAILGWLQYTLR